MEKTDVLVVTPLRKERDEFLRYVKSEEKQLPTGEIFFSFEVDGLQGALFCPAQMGNVSMGAALQLVAAQLKPTTVFLTGIAGGLGDEIRIGDVVVADEGRYFEPQKLKGSSIEFRSKAVTCDQKIHQICANLDDEWKQIQQPSPERFTPKLHTGRILFGEKVVADTSEVDQLLKEFPKSLAVEMEGFGAFQAIESLLTVPRFAIVRGISDMAVIYHFILTRNSYIPLTKNFLDLLPNRSDATDPAWNTVAS